MIWLWRRWARTGPPVQWWLKLILLGVGVAAFYMVGAAIAIEEAAWRL